MKIETKYSPGDRFFIADKSFVEEVTVGLVRVEHAESPGLDGHSIFSNFAAQNKHVEQYMCVETGVGSGRVFTLGKDVYETKAAAQVAVDEHEKEKQEQVLQEKIERKKSTEQSIIWHENHLIKLKRELAEVKLALWKEDL
jgi:hypothetical protein